MVDVVTGCSMWVGIGEAIDGGALLSESGTVRLPLIELFGCLLFFTLLA